MVKKLENPNQGRPGGDNGRGVKAVSGGGRKGGDSVNWVGKSLRAVGDDWGSVGEALRAGGGGGWAHLGTHWKLLNTSKRLENPNQGQQGRPGGRGGDDVECGWAEGGRGGRSAR